MSDQQQWVIAADGIVKIGETVLSIDYLQKLNLLLVTTNQSGVHVYDTISWTLLKSTGASAGNPDSITCQYIQDKEAILLSDKRCFSVRKDLNGMYLLDSALRCKSKDDYEMLELELPLMEGQPLIKATEASSLSGLSKLPKIIDDLRRQISDAIYTIKDNQKKAKWATVVVRQTKQELLYCFSHMMSEMKNPSDTNSALPIAAAIYERVGYYKHDFSISKPVPLDKAYMYSETARLSTFQNWPHRSYRWATPEALAKAGFWFQPSDSNNDRCLCFTCNVCLVSWDAEDEPWSEHEKHQPNCPYVKGSTPTANVPIEIYHAAQPAMAVHHQLYTTAKIGADVYLAAMTANDEVQMWKIDKQADICARLRLKPQPGTEEATASLPQIESFSFGIEDSFGPFKITAMQLLAQENDQSSVVMVIGALCNQVIQLSLYDSGSTQVNKDHNDIPDASNTRSTETTSEPMIAAQEYYVTEPPTDTQLQSTPVASEARLLQAINLPKQFCVTGYHIDIVQQTTDRKGLIVALSYRDKEHLPPTVKIGALLLYKMKTVNATIVVDSQPCQSLLYDNLDDVVIHVNQLSMEFSAVRQPEGATNDVFHMLVTTYAGAIKLMAVHDFQVLAEYQSPTQKFTSTLYCSGTDRMVAPCKDGNLVTFQVNPVITSLDAELLDENNSEGLKKIHEAFDQPINIKMMHDLSDLTECEDLSGKYTATLPSCWNELNPEQQERKHPKHLLRSKAKPGGTGNDTVYRTWKLQPDKDSTYKEHMIEVSLPKILNIGHVELRFKLRHSVRDSPEIKAILLCYDDKAGAFNSAPSSSQSTDLELSNSFLSKAFLDEHHLVPICSPVNLASCMDVSGHSGVISLTSPALLRIKPRTLVVYLKHYNDPDFRNNNQLEKMLYPKLPSSVPDEEEEKAAATAAALGGSASQSMYQRGSYKGMDVLDEITIYIRRTKRTNIELERLMRLTMVEYSHLHSSLLDVVCTGNLDREEGSSLAATENNRVTAMRLLSWIATLQMADTKTRPYEESMLKVVDSKMNQLVETCLIQGSRSTSHGLCRLVAICAEYGRQLEGKTHLKRFSESLLKALLQNMSRVKEIQSSAAQQAFFLLLGRVRCLDNAQVCKQACGLLKTVAEEYKEKFSDNDSYLLSKHGITDYPFDVELFDSGLPEFVSKAATTPSTPAHNRHMPVPSKETDPEVDLMIPATQHVTTSEQYNGRVRGLLDVEPLQYSINSFSEYIHVTHGNNPNVTPTFYGMSSTNAPDPSSYTEGFPVNVPQMVGGLNADEPVTYSEDNMKKLKEIIRKHIKDDQSEESTQLLLQDPKMLINTLKDKGSQYSDDVKTLEEIVKSSTESGDKPALQTPYPSIQSILQPPSEFTLLLGRASSIRRFIVLDFGQPIRLTDVVIPSCGDLQSVAIDVWLDKETTDATRLVLSNDIAFKALTLTDIQPACVCRYLKVTYITRINPREQVHRLPLGVYYGHSYVFSWETNANIPTLRSSDDVWRQLGVYAAAVEDIKCCYKLTCGRLRHLLQVSESQASANGLTGGELSQQLKQTNEECLKLQQQLNVATNAVKRLQSTLPAAHVFNRPAATPISRDKLKHIAEALLAVLVDTSSGDPPATLFEGLNADTAKLLFTSLCVHGDKRIQLLTGVLLLRICSTQQWYGQLYGKLLAEMFTSTSSVTFPKLKVFRLLVSMAQRTLCTTLPSTKSVCYNLISLLSTQLMPVTQTAPSGLIDVEMTSWLLLFISKILDSNYSGDDKILMNRWDFMTSSNKLCKKEYFTQASRDKVRKNRNDNYPSALEPKRKNRDPYSGGRPPNSLYSDRMLKGDGDSKMMQRLEREIAKETDPELKKMMVDELMSRRRYGRPSSGEHADAPESLEPPEPPEPEPAQPRIGHNPVVALEKESILPVTRGLLALLLKANFSCHADMFILAAKVLSRLANSVKPTIRLSEIATEEQIKKLLFNVTHSKFNNSTSSWGGQWVKHSVLCMIEDIVEGERVILEMKNKESQLLQDFERQHRDQSRRSSDYQYGSSRYSDPSTSGYSSSSRYYDRERRHESGRRGRFGGEPRLAELLMMMSSGGLGGSGGSARSRQRLMEMFMDPMDMDMYDMDMMYGSGDYDYYEEERIRPPRDFYDMMFRDRPSTHRPTTLYQTPPLVLLSVQPSVISSAIDCRLEYSSDITAELRLQVWLADEAICKQHAIGGSSRTTTTVTSQGFTDSSAPDGQPLTHSNFDESAYSPEIHAEEFLRKALSDLVCTERFDLDIESILTVYLDINEEFKSDSKDSYDGSSGACIEMKPEAVETLISMAGAGRYMSSKTWTLLMRTLSIKFNASTSEEERALKYRICSSEPFQALLNRLLAYSQPLGVTAVKAFEVLLERVQYVYQAADTMQAFAELILQCLTKVISDYIARPVVGAVDIHCALVTFLAKMSLQNIPQSGILNLYELSVQLTKYQVDAQRELLPYMEYEEEQDASTRYREATEKEFLALEDMNSDAAANRFLISLLKLVIQLLTPVRGNVSLRSDSMDTSETQIQSSSTDEQKRTQGACQHLLDVDVPDTIADAILTHKRQSVSTLMKCLGQVHTLSTTPKSDKKSITLADGILQILHILFKTSTNYYQMLELLQSYLGSNTTLTLSNPLLTFIKVLLSCEHTITRFLELDGMNNIINKLVESYSAYPDSSSGMISAVITSLLAAEKPKYHSSNQNELPTPGQLTVNGFKKEQLINFAPLGSVSSTSPSVSQMYVLIQPSPANRRTRTSPWSCKFPPDQPWVDLTVTLPCTVLIKEIQLHPHVSSMNSSGISSLSVELSHDNLPTLPCSAPIITSGIFNIKVKFVKAELASVVTLRLHKPRDCSSVELSQILVLGYPNLIESNQSPIQSDMSLRWLQLLYHCIDYKPNIRNQVLNSCGRQIELLQTCCSLLLGDITSRYHSHLEKIIIELALKSESISKVLIERFLRLNHSELIMSEKLNGATEATTEILYRVGLHQDEHTTSRISQFLKWLQDCAEYACYTGDHRPHADPGVVCPTRQHLQSIAVIMWKSTDMSNLDINSLLTEQLFNSMLAWSLKLDKDDVLKRSVDSVITAICKIELRYFETLLQRFFETPLTISNQTTIMRASVTDDAKDDIQQELLTDESKEHVRLVDEVVMDSKHLHLLSTAVQSDLCAKALKDSNLLRVLSHAIHEFCLKELKTSSSQAASLSPLRPSNATEITWLTLPIVLNFMRQCASTSPLIKEWLGSDDGRLFWQSLLELFCTSRSTNSHDDQMLELSVIAFFKTVTLNHKPNQAAFSDVLCGYLRVISSLDHMAGSPLTGFTKNLLLQTMLEVEKVTVTVSSKGLNYVFSSQNSLTPHHLSSGVGHSIKTVQVSIYSSLDQLRTALTESGSVSRVTNDSKPRKVQMVETRKMYFTHRKMPGIIFASRVTLAALLSHLIKNKLIPNGTEHLELELFNGPDHQVEERNFNYEPDYSFLLKVFTDKGGLALLAEHLPMLYPEITQHQTKSQQQNEQSAISELSDLDFEFVTQVKGISLGDIQYEILSNVNNSSRNERTKKKANGPLNIPPHSLMAFGLFLRLSGYAEMLIKKRHEAKCLIRLVLGVREDGEGIPILADDTASVLPVLPFNILTNLFVSSPLTTDDGLLLRRTCIEIGVLDLVLACLSALSHHLPRKPTEPGSKHAEIAKVAMQMANQIVRVKKTQPKATTNAVSKTDIATGQMYWAKGTGFGTGSTTTHWDHEQTLLKQQKEEEHVKCLLEILAAMLDPEDKQVLDETTILPAGLYDKIRESCLLAALASYLRNDSVLDMSRHIPLYRAVYRIIRALASNEELLRLLIEPFNQSDRSTIDRLLVKMAEIVERYQKTLRASNANVLPRNREDEDSNPLNELAMVLEKTKKFVNNSITLAKPRDKIASHHRSGSHASGGHQPANQTYEEVFKSEQFDSYKFIDTDGNNIKFTLPYYYENSVKQTVLGIGNTTRLRRLAQEITTLGTSLPLTSSSSVFLRYDEERVDIMKILITGPDETPYMNGIFEFDVFFPADYPNSPPNVNLQTTGKNKVRFNPNLYNDGKVCLSILNTWHGRPEEKWSAQTSSFLQVLVSIQSLILVNEPYFNEPGYERSQGTVAGTLNSREYNSNIRQATVKFAMLEMLKHPPLCFKDVIRKHFWLKRKEIKEQIEQWLAEQESYGEEKTTGAKGKQYQELALNTAHLKRHYQQLMAEFQRMECPEGLSEDADVDLTVKMDTSEPPAPLASSPGPSSSTAPPLGLFEQSSDSEMYAEEFSNSDMTVDFEDACEFPTIPAVTPLHMIGLNNIDDDDGVIELESGMIDDIVL